MLKTLLKSFRSNDWALALDFLSPDFFDVLPTVAMTRLLGVLSRNSLNTDLIQSTRGLWQRVQADLDRDAKESGLERQGQLILKLYFAAIVGPRPCFLDLRSECFTSERNWQPKPWIFSFSPDFVLALGQVYEGFYENRPQLFQNGLTALKLSHSETLFLDIFGRVQGGSMIFRLQDFRESFHKIFLSCKKHKTSLHPEFLPLGLCSSAYMSMRKNSVFPSVQDEPGLMSVALLLGKTRGLWHEGCGCRGFRFRRTCTPGFFA